MSRGFSLFETPLGHCGIAWGERGIVGVQLPERGERETRARMTRRFPDARETAPPRDVARAVDGIVSLLSGRRTALDDVVLDLDAVPPFHRKVYEAARRIPPGSTLSYGEVAAIVASPGAARAVGQALGKNPFAIVVPCHRVLAAGGKTGGFSANGGVTTKLRMLAIESGTSAAPTLFDGIDVFPFDAREAVRHLRTVDADLAKLIDAVGPFRMRLRRAPTVFSALSEAIVSQQLSGKAAATIYARVAALFPAAHGGPTAAHVLGASDATLRSAGLSRPKTLALKDLARRVEDRELPTMDELRTMDEDAIVERLTAVRGIGRWTVEMLLMFHLGRPDVLPVNDLGIQKGFSVAYRKKTLPDPKALAKHGDRWRPYRTVASWYLWRALELSP